MKKNNRRQFLKNLFLGGLVSGLSFSTTQKIFAIEILNYETLYASLYPKSNQEEAFLKDVANQIKNQTIPVKIAYASYRYAMKKRKSERIIYFEKCLMILCKRANIKVKLLPLD